MNNASKQVQGTSISRLSIMDIEASSTSTIELSAQKVAQPPLQKIEKNPFFFGR